MTEIEEIKERWNYPNADKLLSLLEKEEQAHTMSVFDLNMKIAELGIALEKEKERVRILEQTMTCDPNHWDGAYVDWATKDVESRLQKLVEAVEKHKATPNDTHEDSNGQQVYFLAKFVADRQLYKVLEEVSK